MIREVQLRGVSWNLRFPERGTQKEKASAAATKLKNLREKGHPAEYKLATLLYHGSTVADYGS